MADSPPPSPSIVEDIAVLARRLAEKEPYKSVSGPEALRAFADHLQDVARDDGAERHGVVSVEFRRKKNAVVRVGVRKKKVSK